MFVLIALAIAFLWLAMFFSSVATMVEATERAELQEGLR